PLLLAPTALIHLNAAAPPAISPPPLHDALPTSDAGSGLAPAPYKLVSSTIDFPASCSGTPLFSGSQTSFTHSSLTNGTTYFYRQFARAHAGTPATVITPIPAPHAPNTTAPAGSL